MRKLSTPDVEIDSTATQGGADTVQVLAMVEGLTAGERNRVLPVLEAAVRRAESGNYTFTDSRSVSDRERESTPSPSSLGPTPGLEGRYKQDVDAARKVMEGRGLAKEFDAVLSVQQRKFLERRRSEEAEVKGETVEQILDWAMSSGDATFLAAQIRKAADHLTAQRKAEIAKLPFFKRMGARVNRVRSFLGNDHGTEQIDVVADAVRKLNAGGAKEKITGAQFIAALRETHPGAFTAPGVPVSAVRQQAELN